MTICVSVKVRDGIVLGTDSMTQIIGQLPDGNLAPVKNYSNARKLFQIGALPIAVMTYGVGNLGSRSIQSLVLEFSQRYKGDADLETIGNELFEFFQVVYNDVYAEKDNKMVLGVYIAGYTSGEPFPGEWEFLLPRDDQVRQVRPLEQFGASWRGTDIPFLRLYKGYDPRAIDELIKAGVSDTLLRETFQHFESPVVYDGMPVQDAINFAVFILNTTIGLSSFEVGNPMCGGPLQVSMILPDSEDGIEWIEKPKLSVQL